jgi:hypothetical protein
MPKAIFDLNDGDSVDYLNFTRAEPAASSTRTAEKRKPGRPAKVKTVVPRIIRDAPGVADALEEEPQSYIPYIPEDHIAPSAAKKIPLKSVAEHQALLNLLNSYIMSARFGPVVKNCGLNLKNLSTKSIAELKELKERVRACCSNLGGGDTGIVSAFTLTFCKSAEAVAPKRVMDLTGYSDAVQSNPEFAGLCEMIEIDSGYVSCLTPIQRLGICLARSAVSVAGNNKLKAAAGIASHNLLASLQQQQQAQESQSDAVPINRVSAFEVNVPAIVSPEPVQEPVITYIPEDTRPIHTRPVQNI